MSELFLYSWMHSNSFRLQVLMSLLLSHLYACMRIIYMYNPPPNFDTNPRSKKKHKTLENTGQPHQTRVHREGGTTYIYIYISYVPRCNPQQKETGLNSAFLRDLFYQEEKTKNWAQASTRTHGTRPGRRPGVLAAAVTPIRQELAHVLVPRPAFNERSLGRTDLCEILHLGGDCALTFTWARF